MKWLRLYHDARTDAKLESLPDDEFRVWFKLLCFANEQHERGVITGFSDRLLAVEVARGNKELLDRTLTSLEELRIIERGESELTFRAWGKRQFSSDDVSERVQKHRERRAERDSNDDVTLQGRYVTPPEAEAEADTDTESDLTTPTTAREARKTADVLVHAEFVNDSLAVVTERVARSFELRPEFPARDGPMLAEKFIRWNGYTKKPPKDWFSAWLNWIKKELNSDYRTQANGRTQTTKHDPASQITRPGQFDDIIIRSG